MSVAALATAVSARYPDVVVAREEATLIVRGDELLEALAWLRDEPGVALDALSSVTATHWPDRDPSFWVVYELRSTTLAQRLRVKVGLRDDDQHVTSVTGLFLGLGLAKGLNALFKVLGFVLPTAATVFRERTVIVSLLVGIVITLVASLRPALRATRVPPIAAVREGSMLPPSRLARFGPATGIVDLPRQPRLPRVDAQRIDEILAAKLHRFGHPTAALSGFAWAASRERNVRTCSIRLPSCLVTMMQLLGVSVFQSAYR